MDNQNIKYVGFWSRTGATLIDSIITFLITAPFLTFYYGDSYWDETAFFIGGFDFIVSYLLPAVAVIWFWVAKLATPGKMAVRAIIVDAATGNAPTTVQFITRYLAYFISSIPLGLGFLWIAFDSRKQGWHDKLAGTVVIDSQKVESSNLEASETV